MRKTLWVTSTLGGVGKSSFTAALTHLADANVIPNLVLLDLDTDPRVGHYFNPEHEHVWESDKARLAALVELLFGSRNTRLLVNFPSASHEMVKNVPETLYVAGSVAQQGWHVGLVHLLEPSAGEVSLASLSQENPLFDMAEKRWVLIPDHRGTPSWSQLNIPSIDGVLHYPAWGELLPGPRFSAILERRAEDVALFEEGCVTMWVQHLASVLAPIVDWFSVDEEPFTTPALATPTTETSDTEA